jgi:TIR domain
MAGHIPGAFWSYAHQDDTDEHGAVRRFAEEIRAQYSLTTGHDLELFIDRASLKWGDEWRRRIDEALVSTTFFIPLITPRYFTRDECRRELLTFARHAEALGVKELICPLLYVPVRDLTEENQDPAVALVARAQLVDWTTLRLRDFQSEDHRQAISELVNRLAEVATTIASRQEVHEATVDEESERAGLLETLNQLQALMPEWREAVEADALVYEQFFATDHVLEEKMRKLKSGPPGARYALLRRQIGEYLPLLERQAKIEDQLLAKTIELSPLVARLCRLVATHPEEVSALEDVYGAFGTVAESYRRRNLDKMEPIVTWARRNAHKTRSMGKLLRVVEQGEAATRDTNRLLQEWLDELESVDPRLSDKDPRDPEQSSEHKS